MSTQQFDPEHPELGWQPAVPLPLFVGWRLRSCRCDCGQTFRGGRARAAYERHWRALHVGSPS